MKGDGMAINNKFSLRHKEKEHCMDIDKKKKKNKKRQKEKNRKREYDGLHVAISREKALSTVSSQT